MYKLKTWVVPIVHFRSPSAHADASSSRARERSRVMLPSSSLANARAARVVVVRERALGRSSASRASVVNQRGRATTTRTSVRASASFSTAGARISGTGKALPEKYLTNDDLSRLVETNDEWITARTGIRKRHVISGDETLTSLCAKAAMQALDRANVKAEDVDLIILAT